MRRKSRKPRRPTGKGVQPRRGPRAAESEPRLEGEEWVEWGDQRIWAVGFTAGGAPYGLTEEEMRECSTGLIDWEQARFGDPAYDLAIVTRGARRPFQLADGLDRLLEAYAARSMEIRKDHVHLYELCLRTRQYAEALAGNAGMHPPEVLLDNVYSTFGRVLKMSRT